MANIVRDGGEVRIELGALEKAEAVHGDITFPRSAIREVRVSERGLDEVHGVKLGTRLPGVIAVGSFFAPGRRTFAVCHGNGPAVVIDVTGQAYDTYVVTVDNPQQARALLA